MMLKVARNYWHKNLKNTHMIFNATHSAFSFLPGNPISPMLPFAPGCPSGPGCPGNPGSPFSPKLKTSHKCHIFFASVVNYVTGKLLSLRYC